MCVSGGRGGDEAGEVALNHVDSPEYYSYLGSLALSCRFQKYNFLGGRQARMII